MASTGKVMTKAYIHEREGVYIKMAQCILMKALDPVMPLNYFIYITMYKCYTKYRVRRKETTNGSMNIIFKPNLW